MAQTLRAVASERRLHVTTATGYDLDSNGRVERSEGTLKVYVRRALLNAHLWTKWWFHAVEHAPLLPRRRTQQRQVPLAWLVCGCFVAI